MKTDLCVFLDAGHGGYDANGKYVTSPSKEFKHSEGSFHNGGWFYEGVWNRTLTNRVAAKLSNLNIDHIIVSHEYLDISLHYRVDQANWYHKNFKKGIYISNHANASSSHRARGMEVFTTPGVTKSDTLAEIYWEQAKDVLDDRIKYRSDKSDGDHDKEARFFVLTKTAMPAILIEHLFFDNLEDAKLLMNDEIIERFAEAQVRAIIEYANR